MVLSKNKPVTLLYLNFIISMRLLKLFMLVTVITTLASCHKGSVGDLIIKTGKLEKQGFTTYMYGTHVLVVGSTPKYVLESKHINLRPICGHACNDHCRR